jgi:hypothetical protein
LLFVVAAKTTLSITIERQHIILKLTPDSWVLLSIIQDQKAGRLITKRVIIQDQKAERVIIQDLKAERQDQRGPREENLDAWRLEMTPMVLKVLKEVEKVTGRVAERVVEKVEGRVAERVAEKVEGRVVEKVEENQVVRVDIMDRRVLTMIPPQKDRKVVTMGPRHMLLFLIMILPRKGPRHMLLFLIIKTPRKGPRHMLLQSTSTMTTRTMITNFMAVKKNILRLLRLAVVLLVHRVPVFRW